MDETVRQNETPINGWQLREVLNLLIEHSDIYVIKFVMLLGLDFISILWLPKDCLGASIAEFTFVTSLLFDQITKNKLSPNFDFKKIGKLCQAGTLYVAIMTIISAIFLILVATGVQITSLWVVKLSLFIMAAASSISALIEGVVNLPMPVLPSQQENVMG